MNTSTASKLHILIAIFIVGFLSLFSLNQVFVGLVKNLDNKTKNYQSKIKLGEYLAEDILRIKALFFQIATTTTSKKSRDIIENRIDDIITNMRDTLNTLENGGRLKRTIGLNIPGHSSTVQKLTYDNNNKTVSLEAIDIKPKLLELESMVNEADKLLYLRNIAKKEKNMKKFQSIARKIRRFYKTKPAFFQRMSENIRRLLYEGNLELKKLKIEINKQKSKYSKIKMGLMILVILLVIGIGSWISKIINKDNQKLIKLNNDLEYKEFSVKAILNGQDNMVIVSDGVKMTNANNAIVDFFDEFNNLQDFFDKYECICDLFETNVPDDSYIVKQNYNDKSWIEHALAYPDKRFKVILNNGREDHHFSLAVNEKYLNSDNNYIIVVSLNDITSEVKTQQNLKLLNDNLELIVENKTKELQDLNENLEQKILIETEKVRKKDKQMTQQARFAALGEMIGNIAHQWRQPLSAINTTASGMQLQMQLGLTNDEEISESYAKIMGYVDFLTQTIEDFRGFFKDDKEKVKFDIIQIIRKTLSITNASYKDNDIHLINSCKNDVELISYGMPSELSQVFLNILSNAKDAIVENNIKDKIVHLRCVVENNMNIIYIQDNAGGIPAGIIDKIFDPYFTTKHQSQGTGIGLYMSKDIVEKHMNGNLSVKNINTTLDNKDYYGACFKIMLPIA